MIPDDRSPLVQAAKQRAQNTRMRAVGAIQDLDAAGTTISFNIVAATAGVSRSWLYRQPDIRNEINRLRSTGPNNERLPAAQRSSPESTRQRLDTALDEIQRLKTEVGTLRQQLARAYGQQRETAVLHPPDNTSATCPQHEDPRPQGPGDQRSR
jgi:HAMP domain-containing protein